MHDQMQVIWVDDESPFLDVAARRMAKRGVAVAVAGSGDAALALMAEKPAGIMVTDLRMPGMDGIDLLRRVLALWPDTQVILLTGHACVRAASDGMAAGAFDYLMKPVDMDDLMFTIEDAYKKYTILKRKKEVALRNSSEYQEKNQIVTDS